LDVFLPYVKDYVETFMGKSITTAQWKEHLYGYWQIHGGSEKVEALDSVNWNAWLYGEGIELPVKMSYDLTLAEKAYSLAERWDAARDTEISLLNFKETDLQDFNSNQIVVFLEKLQSYHPLPSDLVLYLGTLYHLSTTPNAEIRFRFYEVSLADPSSSAAKRLAVDAVKWVTGHDGTGTVKGRMKFCRPVLRAVACVDKDLLMKHWERAKMGFHPIARKLVEKVRFGSLMCSLPEYYCLGYWHHVVKNMIKGIASWPYEINRMLIYFPNRVSIT